MNREEFIHRAEQAIERFYEEQRRPKRRPHGYPGATMSSEPDRRKKHIEEFGIMAQGRKELLKHLDGERLTIRQMVLAKCFDCMGYFADGKADCEIPDCSLYPLMPYRKGEKYRSAPARNLTDEQKAEIGARLKRKHALLRSGALSVQVASD